MPYSLKGSIGLFTIKVVYNVDYWLTVGSLTLVLWSSIPPHTYRVILSPPLVIPSRKWWCSSVSRVPNRVLSYRHLFPQSRNPEGYFWHPVPLALIFNPESRPSNEANLETWRTYWGLELLLQFCLKGNKNKLPLPEDFENSTGGGRMSPKWGKGCICLSLRGLTRSDCRLAYSGES